MNRADAVKFLNGQIGHYEYMKETLEGVRELEALEKFDGKVINKRIKDVLREYAKTRKGYVLLDFYEHTPSTIKIEVNSQQNYDCTYYYHYTREYDIRNIPIKDYKRFIYDEFISALDTGIEDLEERIKEHKKELEDIDSIIKEHEELVAKVKDFNNRISYGLRQGSKFNRVY